jgi:hypothetical protein
MIVACLTVPGSLRRPRSYNRQGIPLGPFELAINMKCWAGEQYDGPTELTKCVPTLSVGQNRTLDLPGEPRRGSRGRSEERWKICCTNSHLDTLTPLEAEGRDCRDLG